jgi:CYTH domain-containing protein
MALEQERKFLVHNFPHVDEHGETIVQMYIVDRFDHSLRIRLINHKEATICYKYYLSDDSKEEHEYPFDLVLATKMYLKGQYDSVLVKTRIKKNGWDVDKYSDGLIVAEFEFSEDNPFPKELPYWIGKEVTGEYKYSNPAIAKRMKSKL